VPGSNSSISKKPSPHLCKFHGLDTHNPRSHVGWLICWRNLARGLPISRDSKSRLLVNWSWDQKWKTTRLMLLNIQTLILHNQRNTPPLMKCKGGTRRKNLNKYYSSVWNKFLHTKSVFTSFLSLIRWPKT
jgi:hypothetical protein